MNASGPTCKQCGTPARRDRFGRGYWICEQCNLLVDASKSGGMAIEARTMLGEPTASPTHSGFRLTTLRELLAEPEEQNTYIWQDTLIAGGMSLIVAKPKVGKSTLARNLALAVARGTPFLGRDTFQGSVVYLSFEDKRAEIQRRFAAMGATDEPVFVHVGGAPEEALQALEDAIRSTKAILAMGDPLFKLIGFRDGNDYAEISRKLQPYILLARDTGCHIAFVHHLGKGEREGGDGILGSTALFGAVDAALVLKKRNDGLRTVESIQRYGADLPQTILSFDKAADVTTAGGTAEDADIRRAEAAILEALQNASLTQSEIRELDGHRTQHLRKALTDLVKRGMVCRTGGGKPGDPFRHTLADQKADEPQEQESGEPDRSGSLVPYIFPEPREPHEPPDFISEDGSMNVLTPARSALTRELEDGAWGTKPMGWTEAIQ